MVSERPGIVIAGGVLWLDYNPRVISMVTSNSD